MKDAASQLGHVIEQFAPNDVIKAFAANTAFRAAEREELTTEGDPFRRPVRPADLEWLDYSQPMPGGKALRLTALLGHRMLRNVYDVGLLYLPPSASESASEDGRAFYEERNRIFSALAKPVLERHLFTMLDDERPVLSRPTLDAIVTVAQDYLARRVASPDAARDAVSDTKGRREATTFLLLQLTAMIPAAYAAIGRMALGEYGQAHPGLRSTLLSTYLGWESDAAAYAELLAAADLMPATAAYWQFYLSTSLARGNYLHYLSVNREHAFAFLGAFTQHQIDRAVTARHYGELVNDNLGGHVAYFDGIDELSVEAVRALVTTLVGPLADRFGERVITEFHRGFVGAARLADLWDRDLSAQIGWADRIEEYQRHAAIIDRHLTENRITVDLDTFVESHEETSTTHVHDEHRLVMIESGQMHFWNNVTHTVELGEGDKLLIPVSRLHGSTVLSGSCTYHQPIIPDQMLRDLI